MGIFLIIYLTMSTEKFCLKWNDFQNNVQNFFNELRENCDLADVTFVCENGQHIESHKLIISAFSPVLSDIIKIDKHPRPLIYMRGTNSKELSYIIVFMYYGEVNILQEDLQGF